MDFQLHQTQMIQKIGTSTGLLNKLDDKVFATFGFARRCVQMSIRFRIMQKRHQSVKWVRNPFQDARNSKSNPTIISIRQRVEFLFEYLECKRFELPVRWL